eukprot:739164-Pyramimonas_sp.AAC.1
MEFRARASDLFDDTVANGVFSVLPNAALRGRWASIDNLELILWRARKYLPMLFVETFGDRNGNAFGNQP